jgi:hypothetical protein
VVFDYVVSATICGVALRVLAYAYRMGRGVVASAIYGLDFILV